MLLFVGHYRLLPLVVQNRERMEVSSSMGIKDTIVAEDGDVGLSVDWHATDAGLIPRCGKGFFSQSSFSAGSYVYLCVQSHTLTSVHPLQIL